MLGPVCPIRGDPFIHISAREVIHGQAFILEDDRCILGFVINPSGGESIIVIVQAIGV